MIRSLVLWLLSFVPHRTITIDGKPYLTRYYLIGALKENPEVGDPPGIYLHHFHSSDQERELHNHPWAGASLILAGGYVEERCSFVGSGRTFHPELLQSLELETYTPVRTRVFKPGSINRLGLADFHRATLLDEERGCWTLFFAGRRVKNWGFLDPRTHEFRPHTSKPEAIP